MNSFANVHPRPAEGFYIETVNGEAVLVHPERNLVLQFNPSASLLWHLCDGQRSVGEIVSILSAVYPETASEIARDVPQMIESFLSQGIFISA